MKKVLYRGPFPKGLRVQLRGSSAPSPGRRPRAGAEFSAPFRQERRFSTTTSLAEVDAVAMSRVTLSTADGSASPV